MRNLSRLLILTLALAPGLAPGAMAVGGETLTVFAAASLTEAMTEAGRKFEQSQGVAVRFSFAASSALARQIEAGAPAGVVALASEDWADYLAGRRLILPETRVSPIGNRLVLAVPPDTVANSPPTLSDPLSAEELAAVQTPPNRLALADPAHVPAGIYARQALENLGLWQAVSTRLAFTDNARAALALVARGEAAMGIVYATDASGLRILATLPATSHTPITYPFAVISDGDSPEAREFLAFLAGPEGLAIFQRFGFTRN